MLKKFISLILIFVLVISNLPLTGVKAEEQENEVVYDKPISQDGINYIIVNPNESIFIETDWTCKDNGRCYTTSEWSTTLNLQSLGGTLNYDYNSIGRYHRYRLDGGLTTLFDTNNYRDNFKEGHTGRTGVTDSIFMFHQYESLTITNKSESPMLVQWLDNENLWRLGEQTEFVEAKLSVYKTNIPAFTYYTINQGETYLISRTEDLASKRHNSAMVYGGLINDTKETIDKDKFKYTDYKIGDKLNTKIEGKEFDLEIYPILGKDLNTGYLITEELYPIKVEVTEGLKDNIFNFNDFTKDGNSYFYDCRYCIYMVDKIKIKNTGTEPIKITAPYDYIKGVKVEKELEEYIKVKVTPLSTIILNFNDAELEDDIPFISFVVKGNGTENRLVYSQQQPSLFYSRAYDKFAYLAIPRDTTRYLTNFSVNDMYVYLPKDKLKYKRIKAIESGYYINTLLGNYSNNDTTVKVLSGDERSLVSDPIDTSTGAFTTKLNLLGLEVSYYSKSTNIGVLGRGWEHEYEAKLSNTGNDIYTINWTANSKSEYLKVIGEENIFKGLTNSTKFDELVIGRPYNILTKKDGTKYYFDSSKLVKVEYKNGKTIELEYDRNNLSIIKDRITGQKLRFEYGWNNAVSKIVDDLDRTVYINYDNLKNITSYQDVDKKMYRFTYNNQNLLTSSKDGEGLNLFVNTYDDNGRVIKQENNGITTFEYIEDEEKEINITKVTDRNSVVTEYHHDMNTLKLIKLVNSEGDNILTNYNSSGLVISETDQKGNTYHYEYDSRDNLIKEVNPLGYETRYYYDERDNLVRVDQEDRKLLENYYNSEDLLIKTVDGQGNETKYTYNSDKQVVQIEQPNGGITHYEYTNGYLTKTTDPTGVSFTYTHDSVGRLLTTTDNENNVTSMQYDSKNNLVKVIDSLGREIKYNYDIRGRKISETDQIGNTTIYKYDTNNNLKEVKNSLGHTVKYNYDLEDRLIETVDSKGNSTKFIYDINNRIIEVIDALGNSVKTNYDSVGNIINTTDSYGVASGYVLYDELNRPVQSIDSLGNSFVNVYNKYNEIISTIDTLNNETKFNYNNTGQLINVIDSLGGSTEQGYNESNLQSEIKDVNGNRTNFTYDLAGRLKSVTLENGSTVEYEYNTMGLISKTINAKEQEFNYIYDELGRLIETVKPEGTIRTTYDVKGNILTQEDEKGSVYYEYDNLGRVVKYTDVYGNNIEYVYDSNNNLIELKYPNNKSVIYTYNELNLLIGVKDWLNRQTTYEYDKNSRLIKTVRPNGSIETREYDVKGQLIGVLDKKDETVIQQVFYTYNGNGNLVTETVINSSGTKTKNYDYDSLDRINDVKEEGVSKYRFSFDGQSNLLSTSYGVEGTTEDSTMIYGTNNWLNSVNNTPIGYDLDGNALNTILNGANVSLTYDSLNRLIEAGNTEYKYDVNDNRIGLKENNVETKFVVNPIATYSQLLMETDSNGTPLKYYVYGLGLIGEESTEGYYTYHYDYRGSTVALTDSSGQVVGEYGYSPYGELESEIGVESVRFLYNGREGVQTDSNGLYYMRARYYNPEIKRFINQDILLGGIGHSTSLNRYSYVNGNPINLVDPFGLEAQSSTKSTSSLHNFLGIAGITPYVGVVFDIADAIIYGVEGQYGNMFLSAFFAIPYLGDTAKVAKLTNKGLGSVVGEYAVVKNTKPTSNFQTHHLNQDAAYKPVIPYRKGYAVNLEGSATSYKDRNLPHFQAHKSLETFWNQYRKNGSKEGTYPTNAEYHNALIDSLKNAGYTHNEASFLAEMAREQRLSYGLADNAEVPLIPNAMRQSKKH